MILEFKKALQKRLSFLQENSITLYVKTFDKDKVWELYLNSFPEKFNPVFREKKVHDCNSCRRFIQNYAAVCGIIDGKVVSIWENLDTVEEYQPSVDALAGYFKKEKIDTIFLIPENYAKDSNHDVYRPYHPVYHHLYYDFDYFINKDYHSIQAEYRQRKEVTTRSFSELNPSSVETVLELIEEGSLYRGQEFKKSLQLFQEKQINFIKTPKKLRDAYVLQIVHRYGQKMAIRNTVIGTLLTDISNGLDLQEAVDKFGHKMDPRNFKRPKEVFSKRMKEAAEAFVVENNLMDSLPRRFASIEDISIQDVVWASGESAKVMKTPFDFLSPTKKSKKSFEDIREVGMDYFLNEILPSTKNLEVLVDNRDTNNLVSLIAPQNANAQSLLAWGNNFGWSYNGDVTDSIKSKVRAHGGKTDGVLRISLLWADNEDDNSDLDLHCMEPDRFEIYHGKKVSSQTGGALDVDIINPQDYRKKGIVENIIYPNLRNMVKGDYEIGVHNFTLRGDQQGFTVEIEFEGNIYTFHHSKGLRDKETVNVARINFDGKNFSMKSYIPVGEKSVKVWGLDTGDFHKVSTVMLSPNYWEGTKKNGNKHFFFMLEECINPNPPRGFYNEFLRPDLLQHKKVFAALGSHMKVEPSDKQLSGLGYSSTKENTLTVKADSQLFNIKIVDNEIKFVSESIKEQV